tara:strand:+ start:120 stop:584 length:465 start_codon:yes stop_codon:yes gene_type:complete
MEYTSLHYLGLAVLVIFIIYFILKCFNLQLDLLDFISREGMEDDSKNNKKKSGVITDEKLDDFIDKQEKSQEFLLKYIDLEENSEKILEYLALCKKNLVLQTIMGTLNEKGHESIISCAALKHLNDGISIIESEIANFSGISTDNVKDMGTGLF